MEYRKKATIIIMVIFFFMLATVTMIYVGVRNADTDKAGTSFDGGIMVEAVEDAGDMI
jgi:flagellar basal body-associated protein FliL